ncbi:MAG: hypothetical protein ACI4EK_01710 [Wujia sp.]
MARDKGLQNSLTMFVVFAVIGSIVSNILLQMGKNLQGMTIPFITEEQFLHIEMQKAFIRVLFRRVKQFGVLYLLYRVCSPKILVRVISNAAVFLFGIILSCQMYYFGLKGILWLVLCLLPHYFIYIFLFYHLSLYDVWKQQNKSIAMFWMISITYLVTGVLSECMISRFFIKIFLQYIGL